MKQSIRPIRKVPSSLPGWSTMIFAMAAFAFQLGAAQPDTNRTEVESLVSRARAARLQQDSMLSSYEAVVKQRLSAGIGVSIARGVTIPIGRDRLAARFESVARVGWSQAHGAWGEVLASRSVLPLLGKVKAEADGEDAAAVLPYFPGRDRLWPTGELRNAVPQAEDFILHPLGANAANVYDYALGDSVNIRLPDGTITRVREIRIRPKEPAGNLVVGSLWIDRASGSLVRAAYRPSVPLDLWPFIANEVGPNDQDKVKKFGPFTGTIREIIIDHGLYQGRFWLPRTRIASAEGTASVGRITFSIEQTFEYGAVRALAAGELPRFLPDTVSQLDPRTGRVRRNRWYGIEERTPRCRPRGDASAQWSADSLMRDSALTRIIADGVPMRILVPCDNSDLVNSPQLPSSIYGPSEELFTEADFDALRKESAAATGLGNQAKWSPRSTTWHYGIDRGMLRYNRIEGLSAGVMAERVLGNGYTTGGHVRLGSADLELNAEVFLRRSSGSTDIQATAYRQLAATNDWGNPLGVGASLSALLFGRDDGFYFRTLGAEVSGSRRSISNTLAWQWRLFGEQHRTAHVGTQQSVANLIGDVSFSGNIASTEGIFWGAATTFSYSAGSDPAGTVVSGNTRVEVGTGEASYARAMTELTIIRGITQSSQFSLTASTGSSVGSLPWQRAWFLGGPYTVHGHRAGVSSGNTYWLGRAELSTGKPVFRPVLFADVGWAGNRRDWKNMTANVSGAGIGASMLAGLVRFDVARGIEPVARWRVDLYFEIR